MPELLSENPMLRQKNWLATNIWAKEHALLPKVFRQNVLFSEETTLELHPNQRVLVRRLPNTGMERKNFSETQKLGGKKLMLCGFITHDGRKCLQKVCGTINSIKYLKILQESLLPAMFLGEKLQQDKAPAIISILSKTWFSENGLEILENWPPNSPDINIIENVGSVLKKRIFHRHLKNIEELWAFCQEEFGRIPLEYIQNFYNSIPDRWNKIVQCDGKNIEFWVYSFFVRIASAGDFIDRLKLFSHYGVRFFYHTSVCTVDKNMYGNLITSTWELNFHSESSVVFSLGRGWPQASLVCFDRLRRFDFIKFWIKLGRKGGANGN